MRQFILLSCLLLITGSCSSLRGPHQAYDVPRILGRVLDSQTGQPVHRARVTRWADTQDTKTTSSHSSKGATQLRSKPIHRTDAEGRFRLPERKSFYLLFDRGGVPFANRIIIERENYVTLETNLPPPELPEGKRRGVPIIQAGDIQLVPQPSVPLP
jgi:hypothetical protein